MSIKRTLVNLFKQTVKNLIYIALFPLGKMKRDILFLELAQFMIPIKEIALKGGRSMFFICPAYDVLFRVDEFFIKEPETLRWIDTFRDEDVFWDVGANIGVYSLYAAISKNMKVCAFEPSSPNYWVLNKNIELNRIDNRVSAYCIAISDGLQIGSFNMGDTNFGGAHSQFSEDQLKEFNYAGISQSRVVFNQAMVSFSIDEFIKTFNPHFPNHIKIDIDGHEEGLIKGALATLDDQRLKSVLIELNENEENAVKNIMEVFNNSGFILFAKEHAPQFDEGVSKSFFNYIFVREDLKQ